MGDVVCFAIHLEMQPLSYTCPSAALTGSDSLKQPCKKQTFEQQRYFQLSLPAYSPIDEMSMHIRSHGVKAFLTMHTVSKQHTKSYTVKLTWLMGHVKFSLRNCFNKQYRLVLLTAADMNLSPANNKEYSDNEYTVACRFGCFVAYVLEVCNQTTRGCCRSKSSVAAACAKPVSDEIYLVMGHKQ